jgi:D-alanyl-D-alanine carboxypeptidase
MKRMTNIFHRRRSEAGKHAKKGRHQLILTAAAGVVIAAIIVIASVSRAQSTLALPMQWSNKNMVYTDTDQTAMRTPDAFTSGLCVGENSTTSSDITLQGNESGALFSLDDQKVLFSHDMYKKIYPASITKIMTAIVALKNGNMDDTVTINWQDVELESGSQVAGLAIGDQVTMSALLNGMLVHSSNDCAQAIARHVGGTMDNFVAMMNEELTELGCTGSHFTNPTGLHDNNHYTTVYDIYLMLNEALKYDTFVSIMQTSVYAMNITSASGESRTIQLDSTDHYLTGEETAPQNVTVLGGKTGTTSEAGSCLALVSQNAYGQYYISIIVGAETKAVLYEDMSNLLASIN